MDEIHNTTPPKGQLSWLEQARHIRRVKNIRRIVVLSVLILALLIWLVCAFGNGLTLASDLMESARIGIMPGGDYPAVTDIEEIYQVQPLVGGFVELGQNDLLVYSAKGRQVRAVQHGYSRPAIAVGSRRFCLYNRSGTEARIESRSKTLKTLSFDNPLMLCAMSPNGSLAAVTRSGRYAAELKVYNSSMNFVFGWNLTDQEGIPARMAFASDNHRVAVGTIRAENGRLGTGLYWLDTRKDEIQASVWVPDSTLLHLQWLSGKQVVAVFNDHTAVYQAATGELLAHYDYGGSAVRSVHVNGKNTALLLAEGVGGRAVRLAVLDDKLELQGETWVQPGAFEVVCTHKAAYSLSQDAVKCYSLSGKEKWHKPLEQPGKALVDGRDLLVFTGEQVEELEPPSRKEAAQSADEMALAETASSQAASEEGASSQAAASKGETP